MDSTRRFVIGQGEVRGEWVRLGESWRQVLARRPYPEAVSSLLGECLAAAALLTSTLKMLQDDGRLTLQIQGGRPVSLLVAECRADLSVRAMARFEEDLPNGGGSSVDLVRGASFAVTIDPGGDYDTYQSLVPKEGHSVSEALNAYMLRSEQIESHFVLAADRRVCAGLLVQKIPIQGGSLPTDADPDRWNRVRTLAGTLEGEELIGLDCESVLHRLFHQEEVRVLPERPVSFRCSCSKERVANLLKVLGRDEIQGLLADRRTVDVDCDFCGRRYTFTADEAWRALDA